MYVINALVLTNIYNNIYVNVMYLPIYYTIGIMMFAVKKDKCMGCKTLISDKDKVYT